MNGEERPWRPRWWLFGSLGALTVVHLVANGGWTPDMTVGLPIGLAVTLVLAFVRRLPWWLTGELPARRRALVLAGLGGLVLLDAVIVAALFAHPPHGGDVVNAAVVVAIFAGGTGFAASRLLPKRPPTRASLRSRFRFATAVVWAAGGFVLTLEVAAVVLLGGWLPWFIPVAGGMAVVALAVWRSDLAGPARCLASDRWTPVAAASFDVRPGEPVNGWAVLPDDVRIRFHLPVTPPDVAAELAGRRRLWLAGWPSEHLVAGLPDGDSYAVGTIGHRDGGGKNTVTAGSGRR